MITADIHTETMKQPLVPWTRWHSTDAANNSPCPRCGSQPGEPCRLPTGRKLNNVHGERLRQFNADFPQYREQGINKMTLKKPDFLS